MTATTVTAPVKIGDFFVCSWGYDQTNIDFYKVVAITPSGKSVKLQRWQSKRVGGTGYSDSMVPGDKPRTVVDWTNVDRTADYWTQQEQKVERDSKPFTKRLRDSYDGGVAVTMNSYSNAYPWDGQAESATAAGYGH